MEIARSGGRDERFQAVHVLAVHPRGERTAHVLIEVAADAAAAETTRGYAAMGLGNAWRSIGDETRDMACAMARGVLADEGLAAPDGILRFLVTLCGGADVVRRRLEEHIEGHPLEILVLEKSSDPDAADRLWAILEETPDVDHSRYYSRRCAAAEALIARGDERGLEVLMSQLARQGHPGDPRRHYLFHRLSKVVGDDFGYTSPTPAAELDEAVRRMLDWWEENRSTYRLLPQ